MAPGARRQVTGILVAGGKSSRMGSDKALLDFCGAPMIAWCAAAVAECSKSIVVCSQSEAHALRAARAVEGAWPRFTVLRGLEVRTAVDGAAGAGPLAGVAAGLATAATEFVVVSACDTPLVPAAFYRHLLDAIGTHEGVVPRLDAPEPLLSAWRRAPAAAAAERLVVERRGPRALAEELDVLWVTAADLGAWGIDPARLASANTPAALKALSVLARAPPKA